MHGLQEIFKLVIPLCKTVSLDIKDAYYSIPVFKFNVLQYKLLADNLLKQCF